MGFTWELCCGAPWVSSPVSTARLSHGRLTVYRIYQNFFLLISLVYVNEIMRKIIPLVNINEMMWKIWEVVVEVIETQPTGPLNTLWRAFVGSKAAKSLTPCKPQGGALSVKPSCFFCWDWEGRCGAKHIDQHANFLTHALSFETERFWFDRLWKACGTLRPWTIA